MSSTLSVLLGDVRRSRRIKRRAAFRRALERTCRELNDLLERELVADFAVLKGIDEIGAVFNSMPSVYEAVRRLSKAIEPEEMRFVLARGEVETTGSGAAVARMDGPAFHRASELMGELKESRFSFAMDGGDPLLDELIGSLVSAIHMARSGWSERQRRFIAEYEALGSQSQAAGALGVSQQAVSAALVRSHYREIRILEEAAERGLAEYGRRVGEGGGE